MKKASTRVLVSGARRGLTAKEIIDLHRRSAIEAEISHMKTDGRLSRYPLKGTIGDTIFTVRKRVDCGHNIRKIRAHLRACLVWTIAVLWNSDIPSNHRYLTTDAA